MIGRSLRALLGYRRSVRISGQRIVLLVILSACFASVMSSAQASTLIAPRDGAEFAGGETTTFKWNWPDANQPWQSRIVWSREADPAGADWYDAAKLIQSGRVEAQSATVQFDSQFKKGQWYWRVCNYLIESSDDLCHYADTEVRGFEMTSTAIADLTKPVAIKYLKRAIKQRASGGVSVSSCRTTAKNAFACVGKWRAGAANYTAVNCTIKRNLRTSKTSVKIAGVRRETR
jgi:hypothetical protein